MDLLTTLSRIETLYGRVLELAEDQERRLSAGRLDGLQAKLLEKDRAVAEAQALLVQLKHGGEDLGLLEAQACLGRVGQLLSRIVAAEERCRALAPAAPTAPSRAQATAAYGRALR